MSKLSKQLDDNQRVRFVEAARQLGADEDEAAFKAKLAQIARQKPKESALREGPHPDARSAGLAPPLSDFD